MQALIEFSPQGEYMSLRSTGYAVRPVTHTRGEIQGFSMRSRSRLMKKISQLKKHHMPHFVTLTYPEVFPETFEEVKYHAHKFFVYLKRKFPKSGVIWKLEFQRRGAWHFHLFVFGVDFDELRDFVPECWDGIVDSGDGNHLLWHEGKLGNEHCVQRVKSWRGVRSYASKYFGKLDERTELSGRFWGVRGLVPFSPLLQFKVDVKVALAYRRAIARKHGMKFSRFGFWGYGFHPDWITWLDYAIKNYHDNPPPDTPPSWYERREFIPAHDENFF